MIQVRPVEKVRLPPVELQAELQRRLDARGLANHVAELPAPASKSIHGRNWQVNIRAGEGASSPDPDLIARIVRETGNEFDCRFRRSERSNGGKKGLSFLQDLS